MSVHHSNRRRWRTTTQSTRTGVIHVVTVITVQGARMNTSIGEQTGTSAAPAASEQPKASATRARTDAGVLGSIMIFNSMVAAAEVPAGARDAAAPSAIRLSRSERREPSPLLFELEGAHSKFRFCSAPWNTIFSVRRFTVIVNMRRISGRRRILSEGGTTK